jgi:hypothetical protein
MPAFPENWHIPAQRLIDGLHPERPFVCADHYLDRLILDFDHPEHWLVVTPSAFVRDYLMNPEKNFRGVDHNPSRVEVLTWTKLVYNREQIDRNVLALGVGPLGGNTKAAKLALRRKMGRSLVIIDQHVPNANQCWTVARVLRTTAPGYDPTMNDHLARTRHFREFGRRSVPVEFKPGMEFEVQKQFLAACDARDFKIRYERTA